MKIEKLKICLSKIYLLYNIYLIKNMLKQGRLLALLLIKYNFKNTDIKKIFVLLSINNLKCSIF